MIVVLVSNNVPEMDDLAARLMQILPGCECLRFIDPLLSAKYIWNNPVDIVFAAERMRLANGIELLKNIRSKYPELPFIIMAEDDAMQSRARELAADGYWQKPFAKEQLEELEKILSPESKEA